MRLLTWGKTVLFWCCVLVCTSVCTWGGNPVVSITVAPSNQVSLSWLPDVPGLLLQHTTAIGEDAWYNVNLPALTNPVLLPTTTGTRFYRTYAPPIHMVLIPAGSFLMGDSFGDSLDFDPDSSERPVHAVHLSDFYMDQYQITNEEIVRVFQWAYDQGRLAVTTDSVHNLQGDSRELLDLGWPGSWISWDPVAETFLTDAHVAHHPCSILLWHGAVAYCNFRSELEGRPVSYDFSDWSCLWIEESYRLPTEAEWEKAARGGAVGRRFPWSDSDDIEHTRANYDSSDRYAYDTSATRGLHPIFSEGDPVTYTSPVGSFSPNAYGLYDMAGNAWEWVWDYFDATYYDNSPVSNPRGPSTGDVHVARGGAWFDSADSLRVSYRLYPLPGFTPSRLGARTVLTPSFVEEAKLNYLIIDLSDGPSASTYPVSSLTAVPPGGWTDEYKTTKLVLRRIPAGTFVMGSPSGELGRLSSETQHTVTLTQDFYIGVFEVTQRQWERVMGTWPSWFTNATYRDSRPVEGVSYYQIRENPSPVTVGGGIGSAISPNWPQSSQVHADSFMGKLRARTGLNADLPTESQWEYACRAGTTTALNSGHNPTSMSSDPRMDEVGRYRYNGGSEFSQGGNASVGTATVGTYLPNAWGLYDMHGNVWEWCLDWYGGYPGTVTDPVGATSGSARVFRGGSWFTSARSCRSANRAGNFQRYAFNDYGLRVAAPAQ